MNVSHQNITGLKTMNYIMSYQRLEEGKCKQFTVYNQSTNY